MLFLYRGLRPLQAGLFCVASLSLLPENFLPINLICISLVKGSPRTTQSTRRIQALSARFGPSGPLLISRPVILWQTWSPDAAVESVRIRVDGKAQPTSYDSDHRTMEADIVKPLRSGKHHVAADVVYAGGAHFVKTWDFSVLPQATESLPDSDETSQHMLDAINRIRRSMQLEELHIDRGLLAAARSHVRYLSLNKTLGHSEDPSRPGFIGPHAEQRCALFGWCGGLWEGVSYGETDADEAVRHLYDAPYHRIPFLQPGDGGVGCAFDDSRATLDFGSSDREGAVISPGDGASGVPTEWESFERPNPLRAHTSSNVCGYPILIAYFGFSNETFSLREANLTSDDGRQVPIWTDTPADDNELSNAAIILPRSPLAPLTRYTVSASWDAGGQAYNKKWTFRTSSKG